MDVYGRYNMISRTSQVALLLSGLYGLVWLWYNELVAMGILLWFINQQP